METVAGQALRIDGIEYIKRVHLSSAMRFKKMKQRFEEDFALLTEQT